MRRPVTVSLAHPRRCGVRAGFTLIEILVATALALLLMVAVMQIMGIVTTSISEARSTLEMTDRLRTVASQLQRDLDGVTVTMMPPRRPEQGEGYFEYIEGPVGLAAVTMAVVPGSSTFNTYAYNSALTTGATTVADTTVGDNDDILMFTTRSKDRPFVGTCNNPTLANGVVESQCAEVAWFVRGTTLYRRVLLIAPNAIPATPTSPYYANYDISAHATSIGTIVGNTLGDLTKREYRFAHPYDATGAAGSNFPYDARIWGQLGLPTLRETASKSWTLGSTGVGFNTPAFTPRDFWTNPYPWTTPAVDPTSGTMQQFNDATPLRMSDDVVLTNVIGFDVKAWDPGVPVYSRTSGSATAIVLPGDPGYPVPAGNTVPAGFTLLSYGAFVDLGWGPTYTAPAGAPKPLFNHLGLSTYPNPAGTNTTTQNKSGLAATTSRATTGGAAYTSYLAARVYDTYSTHYEYDGVTAAPEVNTTVTPSATPTVADPGTDGMDNDSGNGADDVGEAKTAPPYAAPLRGIQVKIRTFDRDSRQIREVTVVQDFLPK